jgi:CheY-like chemotaxis protein
MVQQPFVIISDINLPESSGMECKQQIDNDENLRLKSIPFVFLSTSISKKNECSGMFLKTQQL